MGHAGSPLAYEALGVIAKHRADLHRKLGIAGTILAAAIIILGVYTVTTTLFRHNPGVGAERVDGERAQ